MKINHFNLWFYCYIKRTMIIVIWFTSIISNKSFAINTGGDKDASGTIFVYFENFYYQVKNGGEPEKFEVPTGVFDTNEQYKKLEKQIFNTKYSAFNRAKEKMNDTSNILNISSFDQKNYSVNPTAEYIMHTRDREYYPGIIRRVYNIKSGDTLNIITSDWNINFLPLRYNWSPDGQWLAIAKDDRRDNDKSGSSVLIVNLSKKEIIQYRLEEHIERMDWEPQSQKVAILTEEDLRARTIWNYIIPMAWIQPQTVHSYYLYIIRTNGELVRKVEIAHRIDKGSCYNLFWIAEDYK